MSQNNNINTSYLLKNKFYLLHLAQQYYTISSVPFIEQQRAKEITITYLLFYLEATGDECHPFGQTHKSGKVGYDCRE